MASLLILVVRIVFTATILPLNSALNTVPKEPLPNRPSISKSLMQLRRLEGDLAVDAIAYYTSKL